jgi:hypothetical protein
MKDKALNDLLHRATVPERAPEYWHQFPNRVLAELERRPRHHGSLEQPSVPWTWTNAFPAFGYKPTLALALAVACLALGFVLGSWKSHRSAAPAAQLAAARKYFQEIEGLFPNQLRSIVFDEQGTRLELAPEPTVPTSPPIYVSIRGPNGSQRFVTFSGQQIRVAGDLCDVLVDRQGRVLVVGRDTLWSDATAAARNGGYQVEARMLEATL